MRTLTTLALLAILPVLAGCTATITTQPVPSATPVPTVTVTAPAAPSAEGGTDWTRDGFIADCVARYDDLRETSGGDTGRPMADERAQVVLRAVSPRWLVLVPESEEADAAAICLYDGPLSAPVNEVVEAIKLFDGEETLLQLARSNDYFAPE